MSHRTARVVGSGAMYIIGFFDAQHPTFYPFFHHFGGQKSKFSARTRWALALLLDLFLGKRQKQVIRAKTMQFPNLRFHKKQGKRIKLRGWMKRHARFDSKMIICSDDKCTLRGSKSKFAQVIVCLFFVKIFRPLAFCIRTNQV